MSKISYTEQQKNAINARGHALLVSAAAGSGKTAVLVQRVLKYLIEQKGDVRRLMITTFTEAAASELKDKLRKAMEAYLEENGGNDHLLMQAALLDCAEIGTVHSICNSLILRHFDLLKIDPRCRVVDAAAEEELLSEAIQEELEALYGSEEEREQQFLRVYSVERDDTKLTELLQNGAKFLAKQPRVQDYIDHTLSFYDTAGKSLFDCFPADGLYCYLMQRLQEHADKYRFFIHRMEKHPELGGYPKLLEFLEEEHRRIVKLQEVVERRDYDGWVAAAKGFEFPTLSWKKMADEPVEAETKKVCTDLRDGFKKKFKGSKAEKGFLLEFAASEQEELARLEAQGALIRTYFDLCLRINGRVRQQRRRMACINYDEMEQLAVELLVEKYDIKTDTLTPTAVALRLREDYDEIIVDEFQDTNRAQDLIFRALSRDETNLFMVGDLKQSIYRFRGAEPEIFDQKRKGSTPFTTESLTEKTVLELNSNFRSHPGVLRFANRVFESIMSEELGGVTYDARERLNPGRRYDAPEQTCAEFHWLLPETDEETGSKRSATEQNAVYIARWIKEQVDQGAERLLADGGRAKVTYKDFT
ncbi:MAG: UvrD-helicase domain-containing protein, partial [Clostridia bacterium]|nr:UvrD-helicase domain-containing protein [Clostridia bacterium]